MLSISFTSKIHSINSINIIELPKSASAKLPSRGMVMVKGLRKGREFMAPLEPDGKGSHFLKIDTSLSKIINARVGDSVELELEPTKNWPEPNIPQDLKSALDHNSTAKETWLSITPMARWDWIRWINSTKNTETRKIRIEKTFSKFKSGIRRPCCFNRTMCTDVLISKKGILSI